VREREDNESKKRIRQLMDQEEREHVLRTERQIAREERESRARLEALVTKERKDSEARVKEHLAKDDLEVKRRHAENLAKEADELKRIKAELSATEEVTYQRRFASRLEFERSASRTRIEQAIANEELESQKRIEAAADAIDEEGRLLEDELRTAEALDAEKRQMSRLQEEQKLIRKLEEKRLDLRDRRELEKRRFHAELVARENEVFLAGCARKEQDMQHEESRRDRELINQLAAECETLLSRVVDNFGLNMPVAGLLVARDMRVPTTSQLAVHGNIVADKGNVDSSVKCQSVDDECFRILMTVPKKVIGRELGRKTPPEALALFRECSEQVRLHLLDSLSEPMRSVFSQMIRTVSFQDHPDVLTVSGTSSSEKLEEFVNALKFRADTNINETL